MEDHSRTIIHIDIDCFYAQVEMIKEPSLKDKPLGIQQKNIVVTSNYIAREYGIEKCMLIAEAKKLCPKLALVNGEDLYDYRQVSYKVTSILQTYSEKVERLGLDENYIDVTELVNKRLKDVADINPIGCQCGEVDILCDCGCTERICMGSHIAQEIRNQIFQELHLTVCAGIAHNKLLAKIVGSKNKPNKQSLVFPNNASELVISLELVKNIPWIGSVSAEQLSTINITRVGELQNCSLGKLKDLFGFEKAKSMWNSSFGIDNSPVKKSGKPQSIGLEDSCKALTTEKEVEDKLKWLLNRLMILVKEDTRIPKTIKLTVRKLNEIHPQTSIRETRQCNINTSLDNETQIMDSIMGLFRRAVDTKNKYHITLLGLSFSKFAERTRIKNTLTNFFTQSVKVGDLKTSNGVLPFTNKPFTSILKSLSPEQSTDYNRFAANGETIENSKSLLNPGTITRLNYTSSEKKMCPPNVDEDAFRELPSTLQEELWNEYKRKKGLDKTKTPCKNATFFTKGVKVDLKNPIEILPFPNEPSTAIFKSSSPEQSSEYKFVANSETIKNNESQLKPYAIKVFNSSNSEEKIMCPPNVDEDIFRELPSTLQEELWNEHKRKRELDWTQRPCKRVKATSILNYIVRKPKK